MTCGSYRRASSTQNLALPIFLIINAPSHFLRCFRHEMRLSCNTIVILLLCLFAATTSIAAHSKDKQLTNPFSVFNLVKFENTECEASGNTNGTCYTSEECKSLGGTGSGSCASGLGVCCVFSYSCDGASDLNNTYFKSTGQQFGSCRYKVCPCNQNICSLRLDFITFDIAGPDSDSSDNEVHNVHSRCLEDYFAVSAPGLTGYGHICGLNTGSHMYVESSPMCNELNFYLGHQNSDTTANKNTPAWDIRITQIPCGSVTNPPGGCTQYYYGETSGTIKSFNFDGGRHLADQRQKICFRKERDFCRICFTQDQATDFDTVDMSVTSSSELVSCFTDYSYRDYLQIPGLSTRTSSRAHSQSILCGSDQRITALGPTPNTPTSSFTSVTLGADKTMCTRLQPFTVTFYTDDFEPDDTDGTGGFKLDWEQVSCQSDTVRESLWHTAYVNVNAK